MAKKPWEPTDEEILQIEKAWFESQPQGYSGLILTAGKFYQRKLVEWLVEGVVTCDRLALFSKEDWQELRRQMGIATPKEATDED